MKNGLKKMKFSTKIWIIVAIIFTVVGFICSVTSITPDGGSFMIRQIAVLIVLLFAVIYCFLVYKVPHGNLLKWLFISFDIALLLILNSNIQTIISYGTKDVKDQLPLVSHIIVIVLVSYILGRLNKIKKNRILMILVFSLLTYEFIYSLISLKYLSLTFFESLSYFSPVALWVVLCATYFARYEEHKKAGLEDK